MQKTLISYMEEEKIIVAIEFGSSKLRGAAGVQMPGGKLKVLSYAEEDSSQFIRHGIIYNVKSTSEALERVRAHIENDLDGVITHAYVATGGRSLHSEPMTVARHLDEGQIVDQEMLNDMILQIEDTNTDDDYALIDVSQGEFVADNKNTAEKDPIGLVCSQIEGRFQKVVFRRHYMDMLLKSLSTDQIEMQDGFILPVLVAQQVLTEEDKRQGCALVDFGADTVTVSIYKGGLLRYLRVLPMGSELITRDLMNVLKIEHAEATRLKETYGLSNLSGADESEETVLSNKESVKIKVIGNTIEARVDEILANVVNQIHLSGYEDKLYSGIVLTGGGSNLKMLPKALAKKTTNMREARVVLKPMSDVVWEGNAEDLARFDGTQNAIVSLLLSGTENCCEINVNEPEFDDMSEPVRPEDMTQLGLFTDDGESAQEVRDQEKQRKRDEARARKAEERRRKTEQKKTQSEEKEQKPSLFKRFMEKVNNIVDDVQ